MLGRLPVFRDPNVLVGADTLDDAGVYRLGDDQAIVSTVDFFPPMVDEPYAFGAIAAANALSDIYAMGARPLYALNLVAFPRGLSFDILGDILRGGADKAAEAGVPIIGGHSIDNDEPKYGMAVTGIVHPDRVVTNAAAKPGDILILTKPLGIGAITTGIKRQVVSDAVIQQATELMLTLNKPACDAMIEVGVDAATDITGFGLLGHLYEMVLAGHVGARIYLESVPVLQAGRELIAQGILPSGSRRNYDFLLEYVSFDPDLSEVDRLVLADAQTSGGLLMAVPPEKADRLAQALRRPGVPTVAIVGEITVAPPPGEKPMRVVRRG